MVEPKMNANELADELQELDSRLHLILLFKAATTLRQLQAENEALKKFKSKIDSENKKLFEAVEKANDVWNRATGVKNERL